jgi:hypothetical protein
VSTRLKGKLAESGKRIEFKWLEDGLREDTSDTNLGFAS